VGEDRRRCPRRRRRGPHQLRGPTTGSAPVEIQQIVLAVLGAIGVGVTANVPPGPQPEANKDAGIVRDSDYPYSAGAADTL
jgi:hypothetical protein